MVTDKEQSDDIVQIVPATGWIAEFEGPHGAVFKGRVALWALQRDGTYEAGLRIRERQAQQAQQAQQDSSDSTASQSDKATTRANQTAAGATRQSDKATADKPIRKVCKHKKAIRHHE